MLILPKIHQAALLWTAIVIISCRLSGAQDNDRTTKLKLLPSLGSNEPLTSEKVDLMTKSFPRIVGGQEAKPNKYPSIALMKIYGAQKCAGTIIDSEWVLSAAHCVITSTPDYYEFVAGRHDISKNEPNSQSAKAIKVIKHEKYDPDSMENDISLFKVSPPFKFNAIVDFILLSKSSNPRKGMAWAAGWGMTSYNGRTSPKLLEVDLPILTIKECRSMYKNIKIFDTNICAGYEQGGKDACQGDSGGPLYFQDGGNNLQIGITSWGDECASARKPGVYTDVSKYIGWIEKAIGKKLPNSKKRITDSPTPEVPPTERVCTRKTLISTYLAESLCQQFDTFLEELCITKPIPAKPPSNLKCGWFNREKCNKVQTSDAAFTYRQCKT